MIQAVVSGTEYCYTVTQTEGAATPSGHSEPDCDDVYVPSTCANRCRCCSALILFIIWMESMVGMSGFTMKQMEGYLTVTSDIPQ